MSEHKVNGTKCVTMPFPWQPEKLSVIWNDVISNHGYSALHKPIPGHTYRKRYNALTKVDLPSFRRMPADIEVVTPPRLFRSTGWKYKGIVHLDCELYWEFQYRYWYAHEIRYDWMSVRLLSYCYIPTTLTFKNQQKPIQLQLF